MSAPTPGTSVRAGPPGQGAARLLLSPTVRLGGPSGPSPIPVSTQLQATKAPHTLAIRPMAYERFASAARRRGAAQQRRRPHARRSHKLCRWRTR